MAQEFARALHVNGPRRDGYVESDTAVVTWCVGHLITMSYPEAYDIKYKRWSLETLPFIPETFQYEVIPDVAKQFKIVSGLLAREDVGRIYVCTDSGREGEYIYRLVEMMSPKAVLSKDRRRVWIDSFTDEEIARGIREAKPLSAYDNLSDAAYLRAKEDYLMGINFSRVLTLKYGNNISSFLGSKRSVVSVGRVMTCVLGMVVRREREIRAFVKTPFYRVLGNFGGIEAEWKAVPPQSAYCELLEGKQESADGKNEPRILYSPLLYKENGFKERKDAEALIAELMKTDPREGLVTEVSRRKEKKNPPLLYNLAELQNDCSRMFKISPDETLKIAQELYEKKMTTYPRTDARVLSTAVAKVIDRNVKGLTKFGPVSSFAEEVLAGNAIGKIGKSRYTNDKAITDHYAIIPTGSGLGAYNSLSSTAKKVYETIARRFLAIFYPPAEYNKVQMTILLGRESFFASARTLISEGYLKVMGGNKDRSEEGEGSEAGSGRPAQDLAKIRKGMRLPVDSLFVKEGETSPPKRYTSGSMILAMENAGQLIEDESLRETIKGSGIGTSATRAEILKKLVNIGYLDLNGKTQVITPELLGEMVYDTVDASIRPLLNVELTASWEKGLTGVADGSISKEEYMEKLSGFVARRTYAVMGLANQGDLRARYDRAAGFYKKPSEGTAKSSSNRTARTGSGSTGRKRAAAGSTSGKRGSRSSSGKKDE